MQKKQSTQDLTPEEIEQLSEQIKIQLKETKKCHGKDCLIFLGPTGVGKSTLGNAMAYGSESLEKIKFRTQYYGKTAVDYAIVTKKDYMD